MFRIRQLTAILLSVTLLLMCLQPAMPVFAEDEQYGGIATPSDLEADTEAPAA